MMDVRTLLLVKSKPGNDDFYKDIFKTSIVNNYVTIGNYDALIAYKTTEYQKILSNISDGSDESILSCFANEKNILVKSYKSSNQGDSASFYHPIHIICENEETKIEDFWNIKNSYFSLAFIYGTNNNKKLKDLEAQIEDTLKNRLKDFLIYRSMNLSELVIVIKNNNLREILDGIADISYYYPALQTHTICGFLYDPSGQTVKVENQSDNDKIDLLKITGTIRSHNKANFVFNSFKHQLSSNSNTNEHFIAFGSNDFNLIFHDVYSSDIARMLNKCMKNRLNKVIKAGFSSIKTRLNLRITNTQAKSSSFVADENSTRLISGVQESVLKCVSLDTKHVEWAYPFMECLNMVSDMYDNPALSRIKYFTSDTLIVFRKILNDILKDESSDPKEYIEERQNKLNEFTSGFNKLVERIIRVDGYLSQEPGYSPLIYNMIPAGILEFYLAYIYELIKTVNFVSENNENEYSYVAFPLPALESYISFSDVFPNPKNPNKANQINILEIPYSEIYRPNNLLFSASHEVMHFCGENIRNRGIRYTYLLEFISMYIINDYDLASVQKDAFDYIYNYLDNEIKEAQKNDENENITRYLSLLRKKIEIALEKMYQDVYFKNKLQSLISQCNDEYKESGYMYWMISWMNSKSLQMYPLNMLKSIEYLFKECYADLMTLKFLNTPISQYLEFFKCLDTDNVKMFPDQRFNTDMISLLRQSLPIYILGGKDKVVGNDIIVELCDIFDRIEHNKSYSNKAEALAQNICKENGMDKEEYTFSTLFYGGNCLHSLIKYLRACADTFDKEMKIKEKQERVDDIRINYSIGTDSKQLFTDSYCDFIYKVREKIDKQIKDNV